jgi:hypothetical protein
MNPFPVTTMYKIVYDYKRRLAQFIRDSLDWESVIQDIQSYPSMTDSIYYYKHYPYDLLVSEGPMSICIGVRLHEEAHVLPFMPPKVTGPARMAFICWDCSSCRLICAACHYIGFSRGATLDIGHLCETCNKAAADDLVAVTFGIWAIHQLFHGDIAGLVADAYVSLFFVQGDPRHSELASPSPTDDPHSILTRSIFSADLLISVSPSAPR